MNDNLKTMDPKQAEMLVLTQVYKHLGRCNELQKLDFDIRVEVRRLPNDIGADLKARARIFDWAGLKSIAHTSSVPVFQLRAEHDLQIQEIMGTTDPKTPEGAQKLANLTKQNYIFPNGGSVRVEFTHPITNKVYIGESLCHINDPFVRKTSQLRAWARIYRQILKDSHLGVKAGKHIIKALVTK